MAQLQIGDLYNVVWNGSEWVITWTDDTALADETLFSIGVDPDASGGTPSAALTGTAFTEAEIVAGSEEIVITLTDDTWVATVGADNAITTALIAGIDSAQSEAAGWDAVVKANMVHGDVARTSDTVVTITLAEESTYAISANETITVTIPATALTAAGEVIATPTITITNQSAGGNIIPIMLAMNQFNGGIA